LTSIYQNDPKHINFNKKKLNFLGTRFAPRSQTVSSSLIYLLTDELHDLEAVLLNLDRPDRSTRGWTSPGLSKN
jgi:hypothetical protein